jgi:predicted GIY-YIG superfamily endonuclease
MKNPPDDSWFVYILRCGDGSLYTGIAKDVKRRCEQHNEGTASRYTRSRLPTKLVYQEVQRSRSAALKREAAIKAMTRQEKMAMIHKRLHRQDRWTGQAIRIPRLVHRPAGEFSSQVMLPPLA